MSIPRFQRLPCLNMYILLLFVNRGYELAEDAQVVMSDPDKGIHAFVSTHNVSL